ncbi:MAG: AbrB/MazE/SpoVT family DNA-binding domain-containing protein [Alphaproteobacteria bacterium]|nr:AbrB/MazE/SpoVT family DNA-binding domain-containing protein [Alphaproteobacteria bacterium]MBT5389417.1 AbrB/MazE/SpoVT family DNA-binding domain-containing protein [Alphaproteobacteria bacterium]MBT5655111.1 AbrB/MazE/SpoVT family DNA-binding domain-containing protein [Alphaproteobacteria bacterium]
MKTYRAKIGEGGRIVIPAFFRKELQIEIGEEIVLKLQEGEIKMVPLKESLLRARNLVKKFNPTNESLVQKLLDDRKEGLRGE